MSEIIDEEENTEVFQMLKTKYWFIENPVVLDAIRQCTEKQPKSDQITLITQCSNHLSELNGGEFQIEVFNMLKTKYWFLTDTVVNDAIIYCMKQEPGSDQETLTMHCLYNLKELVQSVDSLCVLHGNPQKVLRGIPEKVLCADPEKVSTVKEGVSNNSSDLQPVEETEMSNDGEQNRKRPFNMISGEEENSDAKEGTLVTDNVNGVVENTHSDAVPNAEETEEVPQKKTKKKKPCPLIVCSYTGFDVEAHLYMNHIPYYLAGDSEDVKNLEGMYEYLMKITNFFGIGEEGGLNDLLELVLDQEWFPKVYEGWAPREYERVFVEAFNKYVTEEEPLTDITITPPNCIGALCHWKMLVELLNNLTEEQNDYVRPPKPPKQIQCSRLVDSQCDLGKLMSLHYPRRTLEQLVVKSQPSNIQDIEVRAIIACYCFPNVYPFPDAAIQETLKNSKFPVFFYFGIHPAAVDSVKEEDYSQLRTLLEGKNLNAVALGAVGLDYTVSGCNKQTQKDAFKKQVEIAVPRKLPIVLYCKDKKGEEDAYRDLLELCREMLSDDYPLCLHGFTSSREVYDLWKAAFPNLILGFNSDIIITDDLVSIIKESSTEDMIFGTGVHGPRNNALWLKNCNSTPWEACPIANELRKMKNLTLNNILNQATRNVVKFFNITDRRVDHRFAFDRPSRMLSYRKWCITQKKKESAK